MLLLALAGAPSTLSRPVSARALASTSFVVTSQVRSPRSTSYCNSQARKAYTVALSRAWNVRRTLDEARGQGECTAC